MAKLPTKVRVDIRDLWYEDTSPIAKAVGSLEQSLGYKITPEVEWPALWAVLSERFPAKEGFVPLVVAATTAWYERLLARLENTVYTKWTEELLDVLSEASKARSLKLHIQSAAHGSRPVSHWDAKLSAFILEIPNAQPCSVSAMTSGYDKDFESLFATDKQPAKDDEWAHVDDNELEAISVFSAPRPVKNVPDRLPTLDMLLRPDELFKNTTPHILIAEMLDNNAVILVQGSHQASLELMASYFQKWGKKNPHNSMSPTIMRADLQDSEFCFGVIDALRIENSMPHRKANPALVLAFIEGILGYQLVHTTGYRWMYRRERALQ